MDFTLSILTVFLAQIVEIQLQKHIKMIVLSMVLRLPCEIKPELG